MWQLMAHPREAQKWRVANAFHDGESNFGQCAGRVHRDFIRERLLIHHAVCDSCASPNRTSEKLL
jgi:hypothetical protein